MSALDRELRTMRGLSSCHGDDACIDEAEAELAELRARLKACEAALRYALQGGTCAYFKADWRRADSASGGPND